MSDDRAEDGIRAARGGALRCRSWRAEALLRMLENVLEVGENPRELIVYASFGKAARDWESYRAIRRALQEMDESQTLVMQSGRPVAVMTTSPQAPMVVSAVNNMVGSWQTPERFYEMASRGETMWGGLTAGAWQYIGSQGVLQGNYELFRAVADTHFDGDSSARWILSAGLGGMGSAQPLAATMAGFSALIVEVDEAKAHGARSRGLAQEVTRSLDEALALVTDPSTASSVALIGNAATVYAELRARGVVPDVVTDMTSAHDARFGYVPEGYSVERWRKERAVDPVAVERAARASMAAEVRHMLEWQHAGSVVFENGNNIRVQAEAAGVADAFEIKGFMEAYLRPLFCRAIGPFRWVALSGARSDLDAIDDLVLRTVARPEVHRWIAAARATVPVQGLPARSCWLGHGERSAVAVAVNDAVAAGELDAPVLFTRDHLDAAGMTHPRIGTEAMLDGSDGVSDWPLLDAMLLSASGADLVAVHGGGGGYSGWMQSAGMSVVADGSASARSRLAAALDTDTGLGVVRYANAGYPSAVPAAEAAGWIDTRTDGRTTR